MNNNYEELMYIDGQWEKIGGSDSAASVSSFGMPIRPAIVHDEHLVEYEYDYIDWQAGIEFSEAFTTPGACLATMEPESGCMGRMFDWKYDNSKTGVIRTNSGRHKVVGNVNIREDIELTDDMLKAMPFAIVDGINDSWLKVAVLVIPKQEGSGDSVPTSSLQDTIPNNMVVRYILENFDDASSACNYISSFISVKQSPKLSAMGYETHWLVIDRQHNAYVLEPQTLNGVTRMYYKNTKHLDAYNRDYAVLTNFRVLDTKGKLRDIFNSDWTVGTPAEGNVSPNMEPMGSGLERYNLYIKRAITQGQMRVVHQLNYVAAYLYPEQYYSDFVDTNHDLSTVKDFVDAHIQDIKDAYNNRTRNGETWHTLYSVEYVDGPIGEDTVEIQWTVYHRESELSLVLNLYTNPTTVQNILIRKANKSDVYTKTQVDTKIANIPAPTVATTSTAGIIKPDGTSISVTTDGTISAVGGLKYEVKEVV